MVYSVQKQFLLSCLVIGNTACMHAFQKQLNYQSKVQVRHYFFLEPEAGLSPLNILTVIRLDKLHETNT